MQAESNKSFLKSKKLTKALFDLSIFMDRKNLSIDQLLFKI